MRKLSLLAGLIPLTLSAQAERVVAQPDPLEPVTGPVELVNTPELRASVLTLMNRAMDSYALHAKGTPAHVLQLSFSATASTLFPGGTGHLTETWISGQNWRWDASLGQYSLLRISSGGVAYDQQTPVPIPLRLKMLASAVFAPLQAAAPRLSTIRTAAAAVNGIQVSCILLSPAVSSGMSAGPAGRQWEETEYCIDPASGLLAVFSEVPGIYVFYGYGNALHFHDRTLPASVTIKENGTSVVEAQLTGIADADPSNMAAFIPTSQMKAHGPAVVLNTPMRTSMVLPSASGQPGPSGEPAIVHVTLDDQGNVEESEVLQTSGASASALNFVRGMKWFAMPRPPGAPLRQRELYIRVGSVGGKGSPRLAR